MTATTAHGRFGGVLKIIRFNVQFYILSAIVLVGVTVLIVLRELPPELKLMVLCGAAIIAFWTLSSLVVSWYVYDHAGVTRWQWLHHRVVVSPHHWTNIHAGFDESTSALRKLFPDTELSVVDIYDPREMSQPSIARARKICPSTECFLSGRYDDLPLLDNSQDLIFLLFVAHEVRHAGHRTQLLNETSRALQEGGFVVLVEHLRDWKNFVAFGPGFLHFYSRGNWLRIIRNAGLFIEHESPVTPFVRYFVLRKERL